MSVNTLAPAEQLAHHVASLITAGEMGAALIAARQGWRDFPEWSNAKTGATFERLTVWTASKVPGAIAAPAESDPVAEAIRQMSAAPAPVSAAPAAAPTSAMPVSGGTVVPVVIERTATDGTVINIVKGMPYLKDLLSPLGWKFAKRGFMYLGDRDTAPNMAVIGQTLQVLAANGIPASSTVQGNEPARPVSAAPASAAPASAAPVSAPAARKGGRKPTGRESRKASPVTVRQVSAPAAPVAPVIAAAPAPVSVPPAAPQPPAVDVMAMIAALAEQVTNLQTMITAPATVAPATVAPIAAPVVVTTPADDLESVLAQMQDAQLTEVMELTWTFRFDNGAKVKNTAQQLRQDLYHRVGEWYAANGLGQVTFGAYADERDAKVINVKVKAASGTISARKLSQQVVGVALTVKGIATQGRKVQADA